MQNYIFNVREDGTEEFIHKDHDAIIEAVKEWEQSEEAKSQQIVVSQEDLEKGNIQYNNYVNLEYLRSTDWVASKYTDEVVVLKSMTEEEFSEKYSGILEKRKNAREAIVEVII